MSYEWLNIDEKEFQYHQSQYENPKRYTIEILNIFNKFNLEHNTNKIFDIGCGAGAITNLFSERYPNIEFIGFDLNPNYIDFAKKKSTSNSTFSVLDIYKDLDLLNNHLIDGLFCFQTLSWLNNYSVFIDILNKTNPSWSMVTSLFYDGPVDAQILIKDYNRFMGEFDYRKSFYNIYSIPIFNEELNKIGYYIAEVLPFNIDIELPKPVDKSMSTYTEKLTNGNKLQISGPILMSWYTLIIKKQQNDKII